MEDELQNGDEPVVDEDLTTIEVEDPEESHADGGSESATEEVGEGSKQPDDVNQAAINKAIGRKHFEKMQAIRERDAALEELNRARTSVQQGQVDIPPVPDPFDENYAELMSQRDNAIAMHAEYEREAKYSEEAAAQRQREEGVRYVQDAEKTAGVYAEQAIKLGVGADELKAAGEFVASFGIDDNLAMGILSDPEGPLITKHLAGNAADLSALVGMTAYQQAVFIERDIRPKLKSLKPKGSSAPAPSADAGSNVGGGGVKYPLSSGATFD